MGAQMVNSLWITLLEMLMNVFDKSVMPVLEAVAGDSDSFSLFLYASILAPIWEEILFRGYVLRTLRPFGKRFAILSSAFLFGLFHGNLLQTPYALLMGLVLGYVTVEYSIGWAVLLHMFNNLVLADLLTRLTANWSEMAYGTLNLILFGGSALVSLVVLLKKRREIRDYQNGEWIDRRCMKCFFTSGGVLALTGFMCVSIVLMLLA
jgi:membrane protease YdiL (CAAX protease family)